MKIVFTGGGTGGHFYPIVAIAEETLRLSDEMRLVGLKMYYVSDAPYNPELLLSAQLQYVEIKTGKVRTYFSIRNFFDKFLTFFACIKALWRIFVIYPDVVFGKGGYASFPTLFAAKILRIPVVIHESDISPGRVNTWAGKFAQKIAIAYPNTVKYFKSPERVALVGIPVRRSLLAISPGDPFGSLHLEHDVPVILVLGGSQGSENINENVMDIIDKLVEKYQVIHQTGQANILWMKKRAEGILTGNSHQERYHPHAYMDAQLLKTCADASTLVISRAGSSIFEIALWGKPSILIPLAIARGDHQRENAYSYARTGAATVIEESNLKPGLLLSVIDGLMEHPEKLAQMAAATKEFAHTDAAEKVAKVLLSIALKHE